jgi:hypothetical protein
VKVDRSRILEALRAQGRDDLVADARRSLPDQVDTERDRNTLDRLHIDGEHLLEQLGRGGLGKMIGS